MERFYLPFIDKPKLTFITENRTIKRKRNMGKSPGFNSVRRDRNGLGHFLNSIEKSQKRVLIFSLKAI